MPITPFHLGPGLFFSIIFNKYLDVLGFLLGNVILDFEPLLTVLYNINYPYRSYPHHGFIHTIIGAILVSLLAGIILNRFQYGIKQKLRKVLFLENFIKIASFSKIFLSIFLGAITHLLFDSFMHYDVFPFWPFKFNPLLGLISFKQNYFIIIFLGILGIVLTAHKIGSKNNFTEDSPL
ncbi:MAG: DUF4184 family protein [Candidatus Pacebacteria bacterium]|nr:DUF4184 family protein [Candidatus Paceibacterota bacterium]